MSGKRKIVRDHAGLYRLLMGDNKLKYKDSYLDSSLTSVFQPTSIAVGNMQESIEDGVDKDFTEIPCKPRKSPTLTPILSHHCMR